MDAGTDGGATDAGRGDAGADGGTASIANCVLMLDSTFGGGGLAASPLPPSPYPNALVQQADGKIVVAGLNAVTNVAIARFATNGSLDRAFGDAGVWVSSALSGANGARVQADGKIVFGGRVDDASGTPAWLLGRLHAFGVLDSSFGTAGFAVSPTMQPAVAGPIEILKDGSIVVGGVARPSSPDVDFLIAKYDSTGRLDPTFGAAGVVTRSFGPRADWLQSLLVQPDGKILVGGQTLIASDAGTMCDLAFARYNGDGSPDLTFGSGGSTTTSIGSGCANTVGMTLQANGAIVVVAGVAFTPNSDCFLLRFTPSGQLDLAFGANGVSRTDFSGSDDFPAGLSLLSNDALVVASQFSITTDAGTSYSLGVARYSANGALIDAGILVTPLGLSYAYTGQTQLLQADGKLVLASSGQLTSDAGVNTVMLLSRYACP